MGFTNMKSIFLLLFTVVFPAEPFILTDPNLEEELLIKNFTQTVANAGYRGEEHIARTADGYLLQVNRLLARAGDGGLAPVLLMHGAMASSIDFLFMGPARSLGYLLADAGYDVYLGNMRNNWYASHENKTKSDPSYWDFSLDEHGLYDLPAMVELVLRVSGAPTLHYVGYSMGASTYMMMCDRRPDLAAKIASFVALAPPLHIGSFKLIGQIMSALQLPNLLRSQGISHVGFGGPHQRELVKILCNFQDSSLCYLMVYMFIGDDYDQIQWDMVPTVFGKMQPTSVKLIEHYIQLSMTDTMRRYDYGEDENMARYGSNTPPAYDLKANKAPVALFYCNNDMLVKDDEVLEIANVYRQTGTLMSVTKVPWLKFSHYDFVFAKNQTTFVNNEIINAINNVSLEH